MSDTRGKPADNDATLKMPDEQAGERKVETARARRTISGPGAADFLAAPGGVDRPEVDPSKGMTSLNDDPLVANVRQFTPALEPDDQDPMAGAPPRDPLAKKPDL